MRKFTWILLMLLVVVLLTQAGVVFAEDVTPW